MLLVDAWGCRNTLLGSPAGLWPGMAITRVLWNGPCHVTLLALHSFPFLALRVWACVVCMLRQASNIALLRANVPDESRSPAAVK
jgi:hypothetical protein